MLGTVASLNPAVSGKASIEAPKVSIIIPIFNEEENVDALVERLWAVLGQVAFTYGLTVVNVPTEPHSVWR